MKKIAAIRTERGSAGSNAIMSTQLQIDPALPRSVLFGWRPANVILIRDIVAPE